MLNPMYTSLFHIAFIICLLSSVFVLMRDTVLPKSLVKTSQVFSPATLNASSLWCYSNDGGKMCKFKNLYYVPALKQFLFLLATDSVLQGVDNHLDLMRIELSSVSSHNKCLMNLAIVSKKNEAFNRNVIVEKKVFVLWRFKWDNIMHVIHDDLLPLHETYSQICTGTVEDCVSKYSLAFADEGELGPLSEWYTIFSSRKPILLHKGDNNSIMCFQEALVGLDRSTIWFQYGFNIPQGPVKQPRISNNQIQRFTDYVLKKFVVPSPNLKEKNASIAVFFSRKINRKILNENDVIAAVSDVCQNIYGNEHRLQLFNTDLSVNGTISILSALRQADFVIGMHGSAMILTIFAKPGTAVIELFPYAVKPEFVSPLRALSRIPRMGLLYDSWNNVARENTVVHPSWPPLLGGIHHLPPKEQEEIESITEVPAVQCCHNPLYLYRMYQDTWINITEFSSILNVLLWKQTGFSVDTFQEGLWNKIFTHWYFPAPVNNINCSVKDGILKIFWTRPLNVENEHYDITLIMENGPQVASRISSRAFTMDISGVPKGEIKVLIWVKSIWNSRESLDTHAECFLNL